MVTMSTHTNGLATLATPATYSRVGITDSNLADPDTAIYALAARFQSYMMLPDPMPLYVLLGAAAGNMLTGIPLWLMLVGPSGCGKTTLLKSLLKLPRMRMVASIKSEAALLSGTKRKEMARDATGGILCELGDHGCMLFMDFTTVLSKSREAVTELLGALRELYDRTWSRDIGGEGGRTLRHTGTVALLAGVTHAIDRHTEVTREMGERSLYYRYPQTDGYQECVAAANCVDREDMETAMAELVAEMFEALALTMENRQKRRELDHADTDRMVTLAQLAAVARTPVPRDYRTRDVVDVSTPEVATRMTAELIQLFLGMEAIGVNDQERWQACEKVALDSMPLLRRLVLAQVAEGRGRPAEIARAVRVSEVATRRAVEDLELLGVTKKMTPDKYGLTDWARARMPAEEEIREASCM